MWFWWFLFVCNLMIPLVLIINGKRISKYKYCGNLWWKLGIFLLIPTVAAQVPLYHASMEWIGVIGIGVCVIQCLILMGSIIPIERAMKKRIMV